MSHSETAEITENEVDIIENETVEGVTSEPTSRKKPPIQAAVESSLTFLINLDQITSESNPRDVFPHLTGVLGHKFLDLIAMAISPDQEQREQYIKLVEDHENEERQDGKSRITELAASMKSYRQLQPIAVRKGNNIKRVVKVGKKNETVLQASYRLIFGGRRVAALAYNVAKHGDKPVIEAAITPCRTMEELFDLQVEENAHRRDPDDLEWGQIINMYHRDGGLNFQQIADKIHKPYQFVRGRSALAKAKDDNPQLLERLEKGDITLTNAIRTALGEKTDTEAKPKESRQRPLTIKQMQAMFDQTDRENDERLETLAACMQVSIDEELEASDARIAAKKAKEAAE